MSKRTSNKNNCYNCKHIKEKDVKSNRIVPGAGMRHCETDRIFQCKLHPIYNKLETFPFVGEMPCWEGKNV